MSAGSADPKDEGHLPCTFFEVLEHASQVPHPQRLVLAPGQMPNLNLLQGLGQCSKCQLLTWSLLTQPAWDPGSPLAPASLWASSPLSSAAGPLGCFPGTFVLFGCRLHLSLSPFSLACPQSPVPEYTNANPSVGLLPHIFQLSSTWA